MKRILIGSMALAIVFGCFHPDVNAQLKKTDLVAYAETMFNNNNSSEFSPSKAGAVNIRVIRNFKKSLLPSRMKPGA